MYCPHVFSNTDENILFQLIKDYPFATLLSFYQGEIQVDHLPLVLEIEQDKAKLMGHFAIANPSAKNLIDGDSIKIIFNGPQAYVSPNWYPTKKENGKAVPTWNYIVVHVKGSIRLIHDELQLKNLLEKLTQQHESAFSHPWKISDAPDDYIAKNLRAIVGFEIEIDDIKGKWKVSQNHPEKNQQGIMDAYFSFNDDNHQKIATEIKNRLTTV